MSYKAPGSPSDVEWCPGDSPGLAPAHSRTPSSVVSDDAIITVAARGTETPLTCARMPGVSGFGLPEVRLKIESSSPEVVRRVAVRMYESLSRYGLDEEVDLAFQREENGMEEASVAAEAEAVAKEDLMGMDYLLRDGFVSYLRDVVKITPPIPKQVVRFSGIHYSKKIKSAGPSYETFGNKLLGCFLGPLRSLYNRKTSTEEVQVLNGVHGYIMPGSMTLLLGPPGSGKSSLLKILAGRIGEKDPGLRGSVFYNDKSVSEVRRSRLIAYVSGQLNKHIPFLSVRETLEFARDCTQGLRPENFTPQMRKFFAHALVEGQDPFLEYVLEILGLKKIEGLPVGDPAVSDVDRQKLTSAELAIGTYSVMLYDQPLSGSDPATTYDLVDTIRTVRRIKLSSALMSLNQLSQEVFDLFDRVILLGEGRVLYQGPRKDVVPYFGSLGYMKPSYVESGEFLEDIIVGEGMQYLAPGSTPLSLEELAECYQSSDHHHDVVRILEGKETTRTYWIESDPGIGLSLQTPSKFDAMLSPDRRRDVELVVAKLLSKVGHSGGIESTGRVQVGDVVTGISINDMELQYLAVGPRANQETRAAQLYSTLKQAEGCIRLQVERCEDDEHESEWEQFHQPFVQTWLEATRTLIRRQFKIAKRLHMLIKLRLLQVCVLGIFGGTIFYKLGGQYTQQKMNSVRSLGFVSTMSITLINLVQLPLYMLQRPTFYKHRAQRFFRTSCYVIAHNVVNLPQTFLEASVYTVCVYFLAGLTSANHETLFFRYLAQLFLMAYFGSSAFFFISAVSSIPEVGSAFAGLLVSIILLFAGFAIYPSNIPSYWKWLMYLNPMRWAIVSFSDLQFTYGYTNPCSDYINELTFCRQYPNKTVGKAYLAYNQLSSDAETKQWLPYVVLVCSTLLANLLALLALTKIEFPETCQSLPQPRGRQAISKLLENNESISGSQSEASLHDDYVDDVEGYDETTTTTFPLPPEIELSFRNGEAGHGRVGNLIEEFQADMEWERISIPVLPMVLSFSDLSFTRYNEVTKQAVKIFDHVGGYANPGMMMALLGGSKTSRTTLLNCLAGRVPSNGHLTGDLQTNGSKPSIVYTRTVGYVERLDAHQPYLSVRESLQFSAGLRLDRQVSKMSRCIHVELILDQLGLKHYANQLVGSLRNATGKTFEIAKKLTIAVELAANPSVLFLEEPISGLDASGTSQILNVLLQLSASDRIIIATLNHPNTRALSYFHQALILTQEGNLAYFGPVGINCNELLDYFNTVPNVSPCYQTQNPVSFVMGVLGLGIKRRGSALTNFAEEYQKSSLYEFNNRAIISMKKSPREKKHLEIIHESDYPTSNIRQAGLVLMRTQRFLWRNVQYTYGRLTGCIMIGLLMGSLYFQIEYKDTYGMTSRSLYIYMQCILIGVLSANNVIPQIGTDRLVYFRERRAKMYRPIFFPISWVVGEIPYFIVATLAVVGVGNGLAGIATDSVANFLTYWSTLFLFTVCVTYFGMMLTFLAPVPTLAAFAVSIMTSMWIASSGVSVIFPNLKFYKWMYWSNPLQYVISILTLISFYCDTTGCGSDCKCPKLTDGTYVWDRLASARSLNDGRLDFDVGIMLGMCVLFAGLAFLFFVTLKNNSPPTG